MLRQIALAYISLTTVLFLFPPGIPVTGSNMSKSHELGNYASLLTLSFPLDYCVAAFGIILVISTFQWFVDGRKNFTGPRVDVAVLSGEVAGSVEQPAEASSSAKDGERDQK